MYQVEIYVWDPAKKTCIIILLFDIYGYRRTLMILSFDSTIYYICHIFNKIEIIEFRIKFHIIPKINSNATMRLL